MTKHENIQMLLNPFALRTAKTLWNFDRSECDRVKAVLMWCHNI